MMVAVGLGPRREATGKLERGGATPERGGRRSATQFSAGWLPPWAKAHGYRRQSLRDCPKTDLRPLQPDFQYIIRPGGTGRIPDAFVLGAQVAVSF